MARVLIVNDVNQVKGMAFNKGIALSPREERDDAGMILLFHNHSL